jgi:tRNA-modifying protein YgfZ
VESSTGPRPGTPRDDQAGRTRRAHRVRPAAVLGVSGSDREAFLQGQLTQEVRGLSPGQARRTAGLSAKGKLLYVGWLVSEPERFLLVLPSQRSEPVLAHLSRYAVFQKATLADVTGDFALFGLYGPGAAAFEAGRGAALLPPEGELAASVLAPSAGARSVEKALLDAGSVPLPEEAAESLRIEAGRPRFGRDADESNLPAEVGLDETLSATKGCYVGQEVVARLKTYGRVSRRLVGFRFPQEAIAPGTSFPDPQKPGHELGRVTSAALSPRFGAIGLGFATRDVPEGHVLSAGDRATAVVAALPFA